MAFSSTLLSNSLQDSPSQILWIESPRLAMLEIKQGLQGNAPYTHKLLIYKSFPVNLNFVLKTCCVIEFQFRSKLNG